MTTPRPVRYRCELYGKLLGPSGPPPSTVRVLEISEAGAFIEQTDATRDLLLDEQCQIALDLPGGAPWKASALVVRDGKTLREIRNDKVHHLTVSVPGFGVEFRDVHEDELERLRDFLELLDEH